MALIRCKDCGKEISDKAEACPYCGCPVIKESKAKVTFNFAVGLAAIIAAPLIFLLWNNIASLFLAPVFLILGIICVVDASKNSKKF